MTYADLVRLPLAEVESFALSNPEHIAAQNALRTLEEETKSQSRLYRIGRKTATKEGWTHVRRKGKCPRKRDLK